MDVVTVAVDLSTHWIIMVLHLDNIKSLTECYFILFYRYKEAVESLGLKKTILPW